VADDRAVLHLEQRQGLVAVREADERGRVLAVDGDLPDRNDAEAQELESPERAEDRVDPGVGGAVCLRDHRVRGDVIALAS
jgi:hypothetical protein